MYLTRNMLAGLKLGDSVIDKVMEAHQAAVDKLRRSWEKELTEAAALREKLRQQEQMQNELEQLRKEGERANLAEAALADYKAQQAADYAAKQKDRLIRDALGHAGVGKDVIPLLMTAIDTENVEVADGQLADEGAVISGIREKWPICFVQVRPEPAKGAHSVRRDAGFSREDLAQMTAEEINRCWPHVQEALRGW